MKNDFDNMKQIVLLFSFIFILTGLGMGLVLADLFTEAEVVHMIENQSDHEPVIIPPAEMCDENSNYSERFVCKVPSEESTTPRQELAAQIRRVNEITNRPRTERRVARITDILMDECPEYALDIYLIGVPESYNWNPSRYHGDYRIRYDLNEPCEDCFCVTDACYSDDVCNPSSDENCVPTSCGPFHIRHIYRDFECEDLKNERFSVEWMCDWMSDNYPNIAAHNAGLRGASTHSASDDYGYRHFLLKELVTSNHAQDIKDWGWGRNAASGNRIVYLPPID